MAIAICTVLPTGGTWAQAPGTTASAEAAALTGTPWVHEQVQRAPDPAVRFGRLPNGLRYALQHNETPKDGVSMRLRIGSGSLQEREDEQGLAHLLEHMAFRGSAKVPDGDMVQMLQRQGLAMGPDTNAFIDFDQTVYFFNFPKADAAALETGLLLFREIAEHLTLDPRRVAQEKGVVLAELRGDVASRRAREASLAYSLAGTLVPARLVGGKPEAVQAATAEKLRRYYAANYRPDNATVIVVGNIDVDAVEQQLRQQFGDWKSRGPADAPDLGTPHLQQQPAEFVTEGAPDMLALTWPQPPDIRLPTLAVEREQLEAELAIRLLNMRLADRTLMPGSPFVQAAATFHPRRYKAAGLARIEVTATATQWPDALDATLAELRQLLERGVQPADLQRLLPAVRSDLQAAVGQAPTRQHAVIADALRRSDNAGSVYRSPAQTQAEVEAMLATLSADDLTAALRRSFGDRPPQLFRSAHAGPVGAEALSRKLADASQRPLPAAVVLDASWPYTDFGQPSAIVATTTDSLLGTTAVQFANGTRLMVKSNAQERGRVGVQVWLGQGRAGLQPGQTHALWALASMPLGGTGQRSQPELMQWMQTSGKQLSVSLRVDPQAFVLLGNAATPDLGAQLQLLAAYAQDPGFRPELGDKLSAMGPMLANEIESTFYAVYGRAAEQVMNGGDARLSSLPTPGDIAATRPDDLPGILRAPLASAADVVIVGDVRVDAAVAAVQATFGSGPVRPRPPRAALQVKGPVDGMAPVEVTHLGQADQAILGWHWAMPDHWTDPALAATGRVAAAVLQARLVDTVRSELGITYSPNVSSGASLEVPGQGSFSAQIDTPPSQFATFRHLLREQLRALSRQPVSEDELQRARQPLVEGQRKNEQTNGHWSFWLPQILNEPRAKVAMLGEIGGLQAVTAAQVQSFFLEHIAGRPPVEIAARAKGAPADK